MAQTEPIVENAYRVRAVHCHHRAGEEEVYRHLKRAVEPLNRTWEQLRAARRIGIKFNQDWNPHKLIYHAGNRQQHVSEAVARAVLRLLREHTRAELFAVDVGVIPPPEGGNRETNTTLLPVLREFGVPFVDGHQDPVTWAQVPGGGLMFERYPIPQSTAQADAMVSVQKMKNHLFTGVTLCLKNLFGLVPLPPAGRPRGYYHHLVRMPYMLVDLGRIFNPTLNIIDALVCQAGEEWGQGEHPRLCDTLIAGDQVVATDACAAALMGHDPAADWLTPPYHRDRNTLRLAAEAGFGTVDLSAIDFASEVEAPLGEFFTKQIDPPETIVSWRRSTAEQALHFREHRAEIARQHAGNYILLQMGQVRWSDPHGRIGLSRRQLAGDHPEQALWLKLVPPANDGSEPNAEDEHYEVYEQTLRQIQQLEEVRRV
jgi:uncharacterized protein (DUF362 family)